MKYSRVIQLVVVSFTLFQTVSGQGFVNLDFEQATIAPTPAGGWTYPADPTQAFPGWTVGDGVVMYNDLSLGSPATVLMGPSFPNFVNYTPLQGSYSVLFQYFGYAGSAPTLSQTGLVPIGTESINFLVGSGESDAVVTMNGVNTVSYTHLDVYKRQPIGFSLVFWHFGCLYGVAFSVVALLSYSLFARISSEIQKARGKKPPTHIKDDA